MNVRPGGTTRAAKSSLPRKDSSSFWVHFRRGMVILRRAIRWLCLSGGGETRLKTQGVKKDAQEGESRCQTFGFFRCNGNAKVCADREKDIQPLLAHGGCWRTRGESSRRWMSSPMWKWWLVLSIANALQLVIFKFVSSLSHNRSNHAVTVSPPFLERTPRPMIGTFNLERGSTSLGRVGCPHLFHSAGRDPPPFNCTTTTSSLSGPKR